MRALGRQTTQLGPEERPEPFARIKARLVGEHHIFGSNVQLGRQPLGRSLGRFGIGVARRLKAHGDGMEGNHELFTRLIRPRIAHRLRKRIEIARRIPIVRNRAHFRSRSLGTLGHSLAESALEFLQARARARLRLLRVERHDHNSRNACVKQRLNGRFRRRVAVAHAQLNRDRFAHELRQAGAKLVALHKRREQKRAALFGPKLLVVRSGFLRTIRQNAEVEHRLPNKSRHIDEVAVGKELLQVGTNCLGRRSIGGSRVKNQNAQHNKHPSMQCERRKAARPLYSEPNFSIRRKEAGSARNQPHEPQKNDDV